MAKVQMVFDAETGKMVGGFLKLIQQQEKAGANTRKMNRDAQGLGRTMGGVGGLAQKAASNITSWIGSFAGVYGIAKSIGGIVAGIKEVAEFREKMLGTALSLDKIVLKIADIRKDVSPKGIAAARQTVEQVAKQTNIPLEVASQIVFYTESAMGAGTPRAQAAAETIGKFAGPAALQPEEVKMLPKLFNLTKAQTREEMMQVLNQVKVASAESIAETGEYLEPFMGTVVQDIERGYGLKESLARMTSMVETTGSVADASAQSERVVDVLEGRNEAALKFLTKQAKRRGIDFEKLTTPEREEFGGRLYAEYVQAGKLDEFKTQLDVRGFKAIRARFSETARRKYEDVLPKIEAAKTSDLIEQTSRQYEQTPIAREIGRQIWDVSTGARVGRETEASAVLSQQAKKVSEYVRGSAKGLAGYLRLMATPLPLEEHVSASAIFGENLALAIEQAGEGTTKETELQNLYGQFLKIHSFTENPELVKRAFKATGGFTLLQDTGRLARTETLEALERYLSQKEDLTWEERASIGPAMRTTRNDPLFLRGLQQYYGLNGEAANSQQAGAANEQIEANTKATKELTDALRQVTQSGLTRVPFSSGLID